MSGVDRIINNISQITQKSLSKVNPKTKVVSLAINGLEDRGLCGSLKNLALINSAKIKKPIGKLIDESTQLLEGCTIRPLNKDLSNLSPDNMVLVHATSYYPKGGIIQSTANATLKQNGLSQPRYTIHAAINHFVVPHVFGDWDNKKYTIIMPMDKLMETMPKENIIGGELTDFFVNENIKLPKGTIIIKTGSKSVPQGKLKITQLPNIEDVKLVETERVDTHKIANDMIKKMGYTQIDLKMNTASTLVNCDFTKAYKDDIKKSWHDYTNKYDFARLSHSYSPYGRSEGIFRALSGLSISNSDWSQSATFDGIKKTTNYQTLILETIQEMKEELPKNKNFNYDLGLLEEIIKNSKTPNEAVKQIEEKLNISVSPKEFEQYNKEDIENAADSLMFYARLTLDALSRQRAKELCKQRFEI